MVKFNPEKHYLGTLCNRGHDWSGDGESLRYICSGECVECAIQKARNREIRRATVCPVCKGPMLEKSTYCAHCAPGVYRHALGRRLSEDHKRKIGEAQTPRKVENTCAFCGKTYVDCVSRIRKYCSRRCSVNAQKRRVAVTCDFCGKNFEVAQSRLVDGRGRYCSKYCSVNAARKLLPIECPVCEEIFYPKDHTTKYCSAQCYRADFSGSGHPQWKGGISKNRNHLRFLQIRRRLWREAIAWAKSLPYKEKDEILEIVDARVEERLAVIDLKKRIKEIKRGEKEREAGGNSESTRKTA